MVSDLDVLKAVLSEYLNVLVLMKYLVEDFAVHLAEMIMKDELILH